MSSTDPSPTQAPPPAGIHPDDRRRGLFFVGMAVAGVGFALSMQMAVNSNFVVDVMGIDGHEQGIMEAARESCGIIALGVLAILAGLAEPLVAAAMLSLTGVGLVAYGYAPGYLLLVASSVVWSQGLHVWMPLPQSMTLALAEPGRAGFRLGQIRRAGSIGSIVALLAALGLTLLKVPIRPLFLLAGVVVVLGGLACLWVPRNIKTPGPRLVFRKRYGLYYLLQFLEGWRKQIFVAFAGYLLVKKYGIPLETMIWLWISTQAILWIAATPVGRLIDRVGERRVLMCYFLCLTMCFVGYAFVTNVWLLCGIYVIDNSFFVLAMALTTYVNRIAPPSEHTATLSMGVAMNHVAAVSMPIVGAILWRSVGPTWVFLLGAAAALVSVAVAAFVPGRPDASGDGCEPASEGP
jgi:MFS transporter